MQRGGRSTGSNANDLVVRENGERGNTLEKRLQDFFSRSSFDILVNTPCSIVNSHRCTFDLPISANSCLLRSLACWIASSLRFFATARVAADLPFEGGMTGAGRLGTGRWRWSDAVVGTGSWAFKDDGRVSCCEAKNAGIADAPCESIKGGGVLGVCVLTDGRAWSSIPKPCDNNSGPGSVGNSIPGVSQKCGGWFATFDSRGASSSTPNTRLRLLSTSISNSITANIPRLIRSSYSDSP